MKVYIAYKFSNHKNKEDLKKNLNILTNKIESFGHSTFLLGRDIGNWNSPHLGTSRQIPKIIKNLKKSNMIVAYIDSDAVSKGLLFEILLFKVLKKKNLLIINEDKVKDTNLKSFFKKTIKLKNLDQLNESHFS